MVHAADPVTVVHGGPGGGDAEQAQGEDGDSKFFHGNFLNRESRDMCTLDRPAPRRNEELVIRSKLADACV
jgi:hypothetical protein